MPAIARDRQISVRIGLETDAWLDRRISRNETKAGFIRQLIDQARAQEREKELLAMFNHAAEDLTREDLDERETLLGAFAGRRSK